MKKVAIMGAGPAGLAAGYHLQKNGINSILFESDLQVGGISKTINYKDFYFDLGGHRFFTKFDEVNELWNEVLGDNFIKTPRLSRIYYNNKFFNYPLTAMNALMGVGILDTFIIMASYFKSRVFPYKNEETFEQWVSNRFGKKLYSIFFKTYTEKVWGIPCKEIQAEWAAQRIKGLSLKTAVMNALFKPKNTNIKTLIDSFFYPKLGPGMMYDEMKNCIEKLGGEVMMKSRITKVCHENFKVKSVQYVNEKGNTTIVEADEFISSIPITDLVKIMEPAADPEVLKAASKLTYRGIITIDIIINKKEVFPDNWIYIHSPEVKLGRIQNFKNWSPHMVPDQEKTSLGLEYFCSEGDGLSSMTDEQLFELASKEIEMIKICKASDIIDHTVIRVPKSYPVYMMGYKEHLDVLKDYLNRFSNLQLVGRYGMFKYNNMDHSIMTGLYAAKNIINKDNHFDTWEINTDDEYHEEKKE